MSQMAFFPDQNESAALPEMSRAAGLEHLESFVERAGGAYSSGRNFDRGEGQHYSVSRLSGHLRRRLITEEEVLAAVLKRHSFAKAEKFITEIFWRTYFKGWMEMRPSVWDEAEQAGHQALSSDNPGLAAACEGRTGIACFDSWTEELVKTGYLHNHSRMWYASIWIFTLGLDWRAGAQFFIRHLRDGCPASNTLGWRWVAGLHTIGKNYVARADNIHQFTDGRFYPDGQLNESASALSGMPVPPPQMPFWDQPDFSQPYGLMMTSEDGHAESLPLSRPPKLIISLPAEMGDRNWDHPSGGVRHPKVVALDSAAISDSAERAATYFGCPVIDLSECTSQQDILAQLSAHASAHGLDGVMTGYAATGYWQYHLQAVKQHLASDGLSMSFITRPYDRACYPAAKKGFFPFKQNIPKWLASFGMTS